MEQKKHAGSKAHIEVFDETTGKHLGTSLYNEIKINEHFAKKRQEYKSRELVLISIIRFVEPFKKAIFVLSILHEQTTAKVRSKLVG